MRADAVLRERFFSRLKLFFYAAAGLTQRVFDELQELAVETCGDELLWVTGLGATETAPFALCTGAGRRVGRVRGLPGSRHGAQAGAGRREARGARPRAERHAGVLARSESLTAEAFDEEGFYRMGDAMRFVDPDDPAKGLIFDGRLAEDFKLSTGTWVSVGPLRASMLAHAGGYVQDVVITGHDREFVGGPRVSERPALSRPVP